MKCIRCHKETGLEAPRFCPLCGAAIEKKDHHKSRANGTGTVYKQGQTWTARITIGWKLGDDGKPKRVSRIKRGFKTKSAAIQAIETLRIRKEEHHNLQHYWTVFEEGKFSTLSKSKQTAYRIAYKKISDIMFLDIADITVDMLNKTVKEKCPSYYTARDVRSLLTYLYELADADGIGNPRLPSYIQLPKLEEKEGQAFTTGQISKLWSSYEQGYSFIGYILIMIYSGMMPGQLCQLKKDQINLEQHQIIGAGMKTKVRKKTPISIADIIVPVIENLMTESKTNRFLPCNADTFYARYHDAVKHAGVRDLPPYSCRHTTATALAVGEDVAPQIIRKVMRWSTSKMLSRYAHPDTSDALAAVNLIK